MPVATHEYHHFLTPPPDEGDPVASRPNDGSGYWPDSSNAGHIRAPDWPGALTPWAGGSSFSNDQTVNFADFSGGATIGSSSSHPSNVTFHGCRFYGLAPNNALVYVHAASVTFEYCTFAPSTAAPSYVTIAGSYQYGIIYDGGTYGTYTGALTVDHCDFWGFGNGIQGNGSTQAAPHVVRDSYFHHAADPGGGTYHHDGYLCTVGGASERYVVFDRNTFASEGNTNGIAMQLDGGSYYDHITATGNYLSGWGNTVQIGNTGTGNSYITFTDNVWSTEVSCMDRPLYGWGGTNNTWRRNRYQVRAGDPANPISLPLSANGQYWWPTDNSGHAADYAGG